ncbi:putative porin [Aliikangiella sp. IMCC44653]
MKKTALILGLAVLSGSVLADNYQSQVDLDLFDSEGNQVINLAGSYYFDSVSTNSTPWAEAAFTGRNSNVAASYTDFDGDASAIGIMGEFMGDASNNLYASIGAVNIKADGQGSETVLVGELGYFVAKNWLVSVQASDESSSPIFLKTKYVGELGGGQFFNVEASIDDADNDIHLAGDFYFNPQTSAGVSLSDAEGYDYGVNFQHFFSPSIALKVGYDSTDFGDTTSIGLTARF